MAPNLAKSTLVLICDMISSDELSISEMAAAAGCSKRAITRIRSNLRLFGSVKAPPIKAGRPRSLTPIMLETLCEHLLQKPDLYLHEMELFLLDEFDVSVPKSTISDALHRIGWSKKTARQKAKERNSDLRDDYCHLISEFSLYHLVYVDESGVKIPSRSTVSDSPAYTQDGILLSCVFQGTTDALFFEDFIEELLHHCGKCPKSKLVLVMDNASFYRSERIEQLCFDKGVKLVYLPPYSPDLNPIEEFFAELKAFIRRNWQSYAENPDQGFDYFLHWCVDKVGAKTQSA
ncbi:hypothetical protein N7493_010857 [Penicillium malachiteum]|uniref:Tc1-like transposase DDE domain-containing protein n=1 Tax=Penicillium malachiteum TaxID=1324776 RepID=A0AAD6HB82_9EURO|nr:hypothetical protein N7493_010857 [Penicillium malachiteum]